MSDSAQPANNNNEQQKPDAAQPAEQPAKAPDINAKLMEELNKYRAKATELENKFKQKEVEELKNTQNWQKIAEIKENEAKEAATERDKLKSAFINREKRSALVQAALQAGIIKEALDDLRPIDYPELKIETNGEGDFTVSGADKAIQRLKASKSYMFKSAAPNVNSASPVVTGDSTTITYEKHVKPVQEEYNKNPNAANAEKLKGVLLQFKKQSSK